MSSGFTSARALKITSEQLAYSENWYNLEKMLMRILAIRFGSIGNALVSIPAIRAIRKELPQAFLVLLCDPRTYELWKGCPFLDQVIVYDQKNQHKAGPGYLKMIANLRRLKFTHSVHFRRFIRSELIGFLSGAKLRIGFDPGEFSLLTKKIPYREDENVILQNLSLVKELGIKAEDSMLEYWSPEPSERVKALLGGTAQPVAVIHPFAKSEKERRWQGFVELAERMQKDFGARVILIGQREDRAIFQQECQGKQAEFLTAFELTLPELASLLKGARLFIGTDSGPLHLAVAVGTPSIAIYGPRKGLDAHLKKWMPLSKNFLPVLAPKYCEQCSRHPCSKEEMLKCFSEISVEDVLIRVENLIRDSASAKATENKKMAYPERNQE